STQGTTFTSRTSWITTPVSSPAQLELRIASITSRRNREEVRFPGRQPGDEFRVESLCYHPSLMSSRPERHQAMVVIETLRARSGQLQTPLMPPCRIREFSPDPVLENHPLSRFINQSCGRSNQQTSR